MIRISKKIRKIISDDNEVGYTWFASILSAASALYGGAVKLRRTFYNRGVFKSKRLPCFIISIGNIVAGGTGKTPMAIYVASVVKDLGYKVAIVSRGYKGTAETIGGIVSDGKTLLMVPETAGDEPYMMAARLKDVPVVVGKNRFKAGELAIRKFEPDILVLDDGFQHLKLQRDLDLVLIDSRKPFGNGHLLPRGMMREPASSLFCANAIILTRSDMVSNEEMTSLLKRLRFHERKQPAFRAFHKPLVYKIISKGKSTKKVLRQNLDCIQGRTVFAFSGLADNHNFRRTLQNIKCNVVDHLKYSDHHTYSDSDLKDIRAAAQKSMSECIVTTEKDYVRIAHKIAWPDDLYIIGIEIEFGTDAEKFNDFIEDRLKELRENIESSLSRRKEKERVQ